MLLSDIMVELKLDKLTGALIGARKVMCLQHCGCGSQSGFNRFIVLDEAAPKWDGDPQKDSELAHVAYE